MVYVSVQEEHRHPLGSVFIKPFRERWFKRENPKKLFYIGSVEDLHNNCNIYPRLIQRREDRVGSTSMRQMYSPLGTGGYTRFLTKESVLSIRKQFKPVFSREGCPDFVRTQYLARSGHISLWIIIEYFYTSDNCKIAAKGLRLCYNRNGELVQDKSCQTKMYIL